MFGLHTSHCVQIIDVIVHLVINKQTLYCELVTNMQGGAGGVQQCAESFRVRQEQVIQSDGIWIAEEGGRMDGWRSG